MGSLLEDTLPRPNLGREEVQFSDITQGYEIPLFRFNKLGWKVQKGFISRSDRIEGSCQGDFIDLVRVIIRDTIRVR